MHAMEATEPIPCTLVQVDGITVLVLDHTQVVVEDIELALQGVKLALARHDFTLSCLAHNTRLVH